MSATISAATDRAFVRWLKRAAAGCGAIGLIVGADNPAKLDAAPGAALTPEQEAPEFLQKIETISRHVHLLRQAGTYFYNPIGNIVVVEQSDGLVLVDSAGTFGSGQRAIGLIKSISPKPVKAVVITHWHGDHNLGLSALIRQWPHMQIIANDATIALMREGRPPGFPRAPSKEFEEKKADSYRQWYARIHAREIASDATAQERADVDRELSTVDIRVADIAGTYSIVPNRGFKTRLSIPDRVTPVEVLFLGRANTAGDTLLWVPRERILATGDITVSPIPYMFDVYPSEMLRVFDRIRQLRPRILLPGHGPPLQTSYLDRLAKLVRDVQTQVTPLAREGRSPDQIKQQTHFSEADKFAGQSAYLRTYFGAYTLNPLIDSVAREARGERLGTAPVPPTP